MRLYPRLHLRQLFNQLSVNPRASVRSSAPSLIVFNQFFPPDYAPTGQLLDELTTHLGQQGVRVQVFSGQPGYAFQSVDAPIREQRGPITIRRSRVAGIWPDRIRGKAINGLLYCLCSGLYLLRHARRTDRILITTAPPFLPVLGYLAKLVLGLSYVCLLYDLYPDIAVELKVTPADHWVTRLWRWVNRQVWQQADGIIVLSSSMKARVVAHCPEVEGKVSIIHSWANPDLIVPRAKAENWFALKHGLIRPFTVLYSGNMGRCHDVETILEVVQLLKDEPIQFVFIGGGAKRGPFMERVEDLKLRNCVFLPYQDKADLPFSLTACDLSLVSVSPEAEGLVAPSKLYSALAAGRPVAAICDRHSYLTHLIRQAKCGATFTNGDSLGLATFIERLSQSPTLGKIMGQSGRHYLQTHFTPAHIARQYHRVLFEGVVQSESVPIPSAVANVQVLQP